MISKTLEIALARAFREAKRRRHEYLCVEHLLYALCDEPYGKEILQACGGNVESIRSALEDFFTRELYSLDEHEKVVPQQTLEFERVLQRAIMHVRASGKKEVDAGDILAAILEGEGTHAAYILESEGITRLDVLEYISHGVPKVKKSEVKTDQASDTSEKDPLALYTVNLNQLVMQGKTEPLIGREMELRRIVQVLTRRRKNNPILVGEAGVGKTALVEGLAQKIVQGEVPHILKKSEIFRLDIGALLAGTRYRGDLEQRVKAVIQSLLNKPHAILFIDEIHMVVGAGSTVDSSVDVSNLIKPVLTSGELRCIGSTTYEECKNLFERDKALARRFERIEITEPTIEETVKILQGLKVHYESHHGVMYSNDALRAAAELSARYLNDRFLPDKAIDVIDEAGAAACLANRKRVTLSDIEKTVSMIAKVPVASLSVVEKDKLASLEDQLKQVVFGQDDAISELSKSIKRGRAGLKHPEKPLGCFLFCGPTGVGKTEVARQLASILGVHFARYDMSEYMEKHTVSRLIGAPPGYVGFDQGGLLTDEIRRHPHCVLLLDEIEKAHPDLFNILLQVMDHATLTDHVGKKADFRNVVLIMTSNAGARDMATRPIGFGGSQGVALDKSRKAIENTFSPEFRNRLDAIITFQPLTPPIMKQIVYKFLRELENRLVSHRVKLIATDAAVSWLAEHGYDVQFGARPLHRLIQNQIQNSLADEILFGKLQKGGAVTIDIRGEELYLEIQPKT